MPVHVSVVFRFKLDKLVVCGGIVSGVYNWEMKAASKTWGGCRELTNRTATLSAVRCSTGKGDSHHIVITDATSHLKCDASKSRYHHMPTDNFTRSTTSNHMLHTLVSFMPAT